MNFKISWTSWLVLAGIVGLIAAVAIPSYGDFLHRAQASEALSLMEAVKEPLTEHFLDHGKWPDALDKVNGATSGKYTLSVAITKGAGASGELEITAIMRTEKVDRRVAGQSVRMLSSDGGKSWICRPGTMSEKNLPASCRS